jgi:hypothetical protein
MVKIPNPRIHSVEEGARKITKGTENLLNEIIVEKNSQI